MKEKTKKETNKQRSIRLYSSLWGDKRKKEKKGG
jgi:hypothetical protein